MSKGKDESIMLRATCLDWEIIIHADKEIYLVWRKYPSELLWGNPISQHLIGMEFVDQSIAPGIAYEYKIQDFNGATGYILAGSKIPLVDHRGTLVLVVERTHADALKVELAQFVQDLAGDGHEVIRHEVSRTDSPGLVKAIIEIEYDADPANVKTVLLFGAVPVPRSGDFTYDGHDGRDGGPSHRGAQSADSYYGSMTGTWTDSTVNTTSAERPENRNVPGDGKFDQSIIPTDLELIVGRIDFSDLENFKNKTPARSELDLLRSYLNRNHAFRTCQTQFQNRAAISDSFPDRPFSGAAWRMFPTCVNKIDEVASGLVAHLAVNDYLLAYAAGGGGWTSCVGFGDSDELSLKAIRCPFVLLLGSYFGDFDNESGLMKSALASGALVVRLAGNPNFFGHRMGLGGTIGESHLLSANNGTVYVPTGNVEEGIYSPLSDDGLGVHQALLGDGTLVLDPVKPVTNLIGTNGPPLTLSWDAIGFPNAADQAYGWRVYRSANPHGPFELIMETLHPFVTIDDHFPGLHYIVRAVRLVKTPSGSFFGLSCGVFWSDSQTPPMPPTPGQIMSKATFIESDPETGGEWADKYGDDGHLIVAGENTPPRYAAIIPGPHEQYEWANPLNDKRALFANAIGSTRVAAVWYSGSAPGFTVEIKSDAAAHLLALYFLDWDVVHGRHQRVDILDGATDVVLDSREVSNFEVGKYLVYEFQGSIKIRLTKLAGPNAVLSGIFFSPVETPDPTPAIKRTLEILSAPTVDGPWESRGTVEVEAASASEFYRLRIPVEAESDIIVGRNAEAEALANDGPSNSAPSNPASNPSSEADQQPTGKSTIRKK